MALGCGGDEWLCARCVGCSIEMSLTTGVAIVLLHLIDISLHGDTDPECLIDITSRYTCGYEFRVIEQCW